MESLVTVVIVCIIFLIAVTCTCVRISYITTDYYTENSVTLSKSTPVENTLHDLERRLSKIEEPSAEISETALLSNTCDSCKEFVGKTRAEARLATEVALYPHLGENNFLHKDGV